MTIFEMLGGAAGCMTAAAAAYRAITGKLEAIIGAKPAGDDSLRDVVMRVDGKIDAHHANMTEQLEQLTGRVANIEHRVFTPPRFLPAQRVTKPR